MLNYFYGYKILPEVSVICSKLDILKRRISSSNYEQSFEEYNECKTLFDAVKERAIRGNNEQLANAQLIYKLYFKTFCHLSAYFKLLDEHKYKLSWDALQDCFDAIKCVGRYLEINAWKELPNLYELLEGYEGLYPYNVFGSSEYIISKSHCSICGKSMQSLDCPHIKGNLYYGSIAREIVDEIQELQAVCLVSHPEDKRCVIEVADDNRSEVEKFSRLDQFLSLGLPHLQKFSIKAVTELRERKDIVKVGRNQLCPCGSGMKFKKCCGKELFYRHTRYIVTPKEFISLE